MSYLERKLYKVKKIKLDEDGTCQKPCGYKRELFSINLKLQIQGNIKMGKLSPKLFNQLFTELVMPSGGGPAMMSQPGLHLIIHMAKQHNSMREEAYVENISSSQVMTYNSRT